MVGPVTLVGLFLLREEEEEEEEEEVDDFVAGEEFFFFCGEVSSGVPATDLKFSSSIMSIVQLNSMSYHNVTIAVDYI